MVGGLFVREAKRLNMTKKLKPYKEKLNTKINHKQPRLPTLIEGESAKEKYFVEYKKYLAEIFQEKFFKLLDLLDHYEIDLNESPNPFLELSLKMAERHVPGFKVQGTIKRKPQVWNIILQAELYRDVMNVKKRKPKLTESAICKSLHLQEPWSKIRTSKSLYNRFIEAKDSILVTVSNKLSQTSNLEESYLSELLTILSGDKK